MRTVTVPRSPFETGFGANFALEQEHDGIASTIEIARPVWLVNSNRFSTASPAGRIAEAKSRSQTMPLRAGLRGSRKRIPIATARTSRRAINGRGSPPVFEGFGPCCQRHTGRREVELTKRTSTLFVRYMPISSNNDRRVVITGLGVVAPNGNTARDFWTNTAGRPKRHQAVRFLRFHRVSVQDRW